MVDSVQFFAGLPLVSVGTCPSINSKPPDRRLKLLIGTLQQVDWRPAVGVNVVVGAQGGGFAVELKEEDAYGPERGVERFPSLAAPLSGGRRRVTMAGFDLQDIRPNVVVVVILL